MEADPTKKEQLYSQSADAFAKAVRLAPGDVRWTLSLAQSLDALRRFSESEPLFRRALELDPISRVVHIAYANHLELQGKLEEAAAQFRITQQLLGGAAAEIGLERIEEEQKAKGARQPGSTQSSRP